MGKLDGLGGVNAPGGFRDGERKCLLWHPGILASRLYPKLLPGRQGVLKISQEALAYSRPTPGGQYLETKGEVERGPN